MPAQIYNMAVTAASAIWVNPLTLVGLIALVLAIVTGLAGRLAILCEDFWHTRFFGRILQSFPVALPPRVEVAYLV